MEFKRRFGIIIVCGIPAIVGSGLLWELSEKWFVVYGYLFLLAATLLVFLLAPQLKQGLQASSEAVESSPRFYVWLSVLAALILLAGYALIASLVLSMEILEFSLQIPWATLVSSYTWLVVAGSGLCIINALGGVFGMHRYEMMSKRIVFLSLTTIMFGLMFILFHLGRPERMPIQNAISPNFRSAIAWMGMLYNIYLVIVVVELWLLIRADLAERAEQAEGWKRDILRLLALKDLNDSRLGGILQKMRLDRLLYHPRLHRILDDPRLPRITATMAFITGVAALTMLGSVFAHAEARALWYGPYYPIYFLVSALFTGYGVLLAATIITYRVKGEEMSSESKALMFEMAQVLALLLAVGFALTSYRLVTGLFDPLRQGPTLFILKGPLSPAFWIFEVGIMSVLPSFILLRAAKKKSLGGVLAGSLMVLVGAFVMRYLFLVGGQIYPNTFPRFSADLPTILPSYMPTITEVFLIVGIFSGFLLAYTLGEKFLPLKEEGPEHA
jgi:molybdopterin-containing oxidoreductase family membrane subunit